jgi:hypothetical protein
LTWAADGSVILGKTRPVPWTVWRPPRPNGNSAKNGTIKKGPAQSEPRGEGERRGRRRIAIERRKKNKSSIIRGKKKKKKNTQTRTYNKSNVQKVGIHDVYP